MIAPSDSQLRILTILSPDTNKQRKISLFIKYNYQWNEEDKHIKLYYISRALLKLVACTAGDSLKYFYWNIVVCRWGYKMFSSIHHKARPRMWRWHWDSWVLVQAMITGKWWQAFTCILSCYYNFPNIRKV